MTRPGPSHHASEVSRFALTMAGSDIELEILLFDLERCPDEFSLVNSDEIERARGFARESDRRHFMARRSLLRSLLSERSGLAPDMIELDAPDRRKPSLPDGNELRFNASRSDRWFAVVLCESTIQPGIDIEVLRELPDAESISRRILSSEEVRTLADEFIHDSGSLLRVWTRKEAVLKSLGTGLSIDPTDVTVPLEPLLSEASRATVRNGDSVHHVTLVEPDGLPDGIRVSVGVADRLIDPIRR